MTTEREALQWIRDEFAATLAEFDKPKGGLHVPYFGDFAAMLRYPSCISRLRRWARLFDEVLKNDKTDDI